MKIAPPTVHAVRAVALWSLRCVSIGLIVAGAYFLVQRIAFWIVTGNASAAFQSWMGVGEGHGASLGFALITVGLALALTSRRLVRWAFPVPDTGCPRCGYAAQEPTCPECGLQDLHN